MSDQSSARLGLPYLAAGQLQKHVTLNESLTRLDALAQTAVQSRALSSPPAEAAEGALFILGGAGEGAWSGRPAGSLMRRDMGGWVEVAPVAGQIVFVLDAQEIVIRGEDGWTPFSSAGGPPGEGVGPYLNVQRLGVGAEADEANPFSAKLNKALWAARGPSEGGDGDLRFSFNKVGSSGVLSLLFQSGFSGRAEIGLVGDDDLKMKVSPDGATWSDVFSVDRATGRAAFARGAARLETVVLAASTSFTPPAWARWLEVSAVGGGGGGGAGFGSTGGGSRYGGGGGAAGAVVSARLPVAELGETPLTISVGAGGVAGVAAAGGVGGATVISQAGQVLLTAPGGGGGAAGSGSGGAGAAGAVGGAGGGSSSVSEPGNPGGAGEGADKPGGGGAGGSLDSANTARAGGAGGAGGLTSVRSNGGSAPASGPSSAGQACLLPKLSLGGGGGGGGASAVLSAGLAGAAGGVHGAGGGGGGAGFNIGGQGGAGAGGAVRLTVIG